MLSCVSVCVCLSVQKLQNYQSKLSEICALVYSKKWLCFDGIWPWHLTLICILVFRTGTPLCEGYQLDRHAANAVREVHISQTGRVSRLSSTQYCAALTLFQEWHIGIYRNIYRNLFVHENFAVWIQSGPIKSKPLTFVAILAMRADFCMKF